ncbi:MAG: ECF transporter S component [Defluviitaleaceae bacterium]|nr:ECF transporter S component [Defluviitaleaceae bacterium]
MQNMTNTQKITLMGLFGAIIFLLTFTPLGFIPLPFVRATTIHIPVIIGSIFLGPKYGAVLGFLFGFSSFLIATLQPWPSSFAFSPFVPLPGADSGSLWALFVAFVPRVFVGIVPYYTYAAIKKVITDKGFDIINLTIAGIVGSMTNTLLVLHSIFIFFGEPWTTVVGGGPADVVYAVIVGIIASVGVPEAIVAGILVAAIGSALNIVIHHKAQAA